MLVLVNDLLAEALFINCNGLDEVGLQVLEGTIGKRVTMVNWKKMCVEEAFVCMEGAARWVGERVAVVDAV